MRTALAATPGEIVLIRKIAERARGMTNDNTPIAFRSLYEISEAVALCHLNGCKLRLASLLAAERGSFGHDVFGIIAHIDLATGQLRNHFRPRYAAPDKPTPPPSPKPKPRGPSPWSQGEGI